MPRLKPLAALVAVAIAAAMLFQVTQRPAPAEEAAQKDKATVQERAVEKPKTTRRKPRRRLPMYYGQIGLSREQREKIYEIQAKYRSQIEELMKQIGALRKKQKEEIEAVLTDEQKERLAKLQEEAQKRRAARKKKKSSS
ncbi:MAG TPA: hypothetical protein EYP14_13555 [Planctomycetaceae bacterium]|nr:hypothetical protein [Planctomycetaceae bacterium]